MVMTWASFAPTSHSSATEVRHSGACGCGMMRRHRPLIILLPSMMSSHAEGGFGKTLNVAKFVPFEMMNEEESGLLCLFPGINSPLIHHFLGREMGTMDTPPLSVGNLRWTLGRPSIFLGSSAAARRGVSTLSVTRRFNSFIAGGLFGRLRVQSPIAAAAPNLLGRFCEMAGLRDLHHRLLYSWHFPTILPKHVSLD